MAVVGAGAFGGWTALHLIRTGCKVTLVDSWGPGNSRSSSGDETRVIRTCYGSNAVYTQMTARALALWKENERRWGVQVLRDCGFLHLASGEGPFERASAENVRQAGLPLEVFEGEALRRRFPQINCDGLNLGLYEPRSGFLLARRACQAVTEAFAAQGGVYRQALVSPGAIRGRAIEALRLADGSTLRADQYVFAAGPWLARLFPDVVGRFLTPTRQEVFYFGTPAGDIQFNENSFPAWFDNSPGRFYGIPGNQWRGFKIAGDTTGPVFDPTSGDRVPTPEGIASAREHLAFRFPALKDAPLLESRVCQYEMSADGGLIADRHPGCSNAWIAGGGSGHGFKFSPALGEHVANLVLGKVEVNPVFALARFRGTATGKVGERT